MSALSKLEVARHQVAIAGRVTEAATGRVIGGAEVTLCQAPPAFVAQLVAWTGLLSEYSAPAEVQRAWNRLDDPGIDPGEKLKAAQQLLDLLQQSRRAEFDRPDRTRTAADGHFHFLDLPEGGYTLAACLPEAGSRYGQQVAKAKVAREGDRLRWAFVPIELPATALEGRITDKGTGEPLVLAEVRVDGSGERAFSDNQGQYRLVRLEAGDRMVRVSARGYRARGPELAHLETGQKQTLDLALQR
jgi:hypothetical protein